jgi:cytochrome c oxidase subunit III
VTVYAPPIERRVRPAVATWGMIMVIAAEGTLFGCFIGTYYYLRFRATQWPPAGIPEPRVVVPLVLVAVLVSTSVPMRLAASAASAGRVAATRLFVAVALVVQCGYFAYEVDDFSRQLHRFGPSTDAYGSVYYVLLGADHGHVAVGLLLDVWLLAKLATGLTRYRVNAVRAIALYWHAVNVLTLAVTGTLLSAHV